MGYQLWSQDNFSKGELSPYMYARAGVEQYALGLKIAQNVLTYPIGAAGKRFGTLFQTLLDNLITDRNEIYFQTFQYLDQCIYQLVFYPGFVDIFLEGTFQFHLATPYDQQDIQKFNTTTIGSIFRITCPNRVPMDLQRYPNVPPDGSPYTITSIVTNQFDIAPTFTFQIGEVLPVMFTTTGTFPLTSPQIKAGIVYFIYINSNTSFTVYASAPEAKFQLNPFTLSNIGTGTNQVVVQDIWKIAPTFFKNLPFYDFNGQIATYDSDTFTPSATTGNAVTVTVSPGYSLLNSNYVGGAFIGGGGSGRITAVASTSSFTMAVQDPFDNTNPIQGSLVLLAEPAWSNTRGWPQVCSSYQSRAFFANTVSLPNGLWSSVINDYTDFGDLTTDDDDAISWFPTSDAVNVIRFIVPYRSLTVHTNTGVYSSPLSDTLAITPTGFSLLLQDSTPADVVQPQAIDNQIMILSGNDLHTMLWDGINNAYTTNIVSIINEQTIRNPVDESTYADLRRAGSRYVFIVNESGSMAIMQTLLSESVAGITPAIMEQSYGTAQFLQCASSADGRAWFVVQRQFATNVDSGAGLPIIGFTHNTLKATLSLIGATPVAITFTTTGTLPNSIPKIKVDTYYWAVGVDADNFSIYLTQEDAELGVNAIVFSSAGTNTEMFRWPPETFFTLEELTHDTYLDCAVFYDGAPTNVVATGNLFNAQQIKMVGNGFGFSAEGIDDQVAFMAHGMPVDVSLAYIGFPIVTIMEPMPLMMPAGSQTSLTKPKHIRSVRFMFNDTIGGSINGIPIALRPFSQADIGEPPVPANGIFEMSIMKGWDDFNNPTFTIMHDDPFNIELIGLFYSVDT